jgi:hypothetical protein
MLLEHAQAVVDVLSPESTRAYLDQNRSRLGTRQGTATAVIVDYRC